MLTLPRLLDIRFGRVAPQLRRISALHRQRRALARLDAQMLADIGISREEARAEAERSLWDAPTTWRA